MYKKIFLTITAILSSFFIASTVFAQSAYEWEMNSFHSDIVIEEDGRMVVTETIEAKFNVEKRGIFREIPTRYYDEYRQADSVYLGVLSVTDEHGNPLEYLVTNEYSYINIRIGNAVRYLTGVQTYVITYEVEGEIGFYGDHDELYWDVTGNDWFVPIHKTSATVTLPGSATSNVNLRCFTGAFGSVEEECTSTISGSVANFEATDFLTIVVGWPKGFIPEPTQLEETADFVQDNWAYSWPLITFILMFFAWRMWGKDPEDPPGLVTQYEPPADLTPAEVAYLVNQNLSRGDLPAELVNLASKGFIHIKEKMSKKSKKADDYILVKKKDFDDPSLKRHEREILKGIFLSKKERKVHKFQQAFIKKLKELKNKF